MAMDVMETFQSLAITIFCAFAIILLFAIFLWARSFVGAVEIRGSQAALSNKILVAQDITLRDLKGNLDKFMFDEARLNATNNSAMPGILLPGTYYFIEIKSAPHTWYYHNAAKYPYAYNTMAHGTTMECKSPQELSTAAAMRTRYSNPFEYNDASVLKFSATIVNRINGTSTAALVRIIIDPDTGTGFYPGGYPLCLCDVPCPYDTCLCTKDCPKSNQKITSGQNCG